MFLTFFYKLYQVTKKAVQDIGGKYHRYSTSNKTRGNISRLILEYVLPLEQKSLNSFNCDGLDSFNWLYRLGSKEKCILFLTSRPDRNPWGHVVEEGSNSNQ